MCPRPAPGPLGTPIECILNSSSWPRPVSSIHLSLCLSPRPHGPQRPVCTGPGSICLLSPGPWRNLIGERGCSSGGLMAPGTGVTPSVCQSRSPSGVRISGLLLVVMSLFTLTGGVDPFSARRGGRNRCACTLTCVCASVCILQPAPAFCSRCGPHRHLSDPSRLLLGPERQCLQVLRRGE